MPEGIEILEGGTRILVPVEHSSGGPGKKGSSVFFNRQMAFNRDLSVMLLRARPELVDVADAMTATGARAVRIANELPHTNVIANDYDEKALPFIEANIALNELENCEPRIGNLACLLSERGFDYVDLDPFGSPVPFLQAAVRGCRRRGVLAVTATDTAPLAGAHRAKCERRYQARPLRGPMCHESGLRILMGTVARELARIDRGMEPLLCYYADHYFRCYIQVREGAEAADSTLAELGYYAYDPRTLERSFSLERDERHVYGPVWGGRLHDPELLARMEPEGSQELRRVERSLTVWRRELPDPILWDISELASHLKVPSPRIDVLLDALRSVGAAERAHVSPTTFRSNLPLPEIEALFKQASGLKEWS